MYEKSNSGHDEDVFLTAFEIYPLHILHCYFYFCKHFFLLAVSYCITRWICVGFSQIFCGVLWISVFVFTNFYGFLCIFYGFIVDCCAFLWIFLWFYYEFLWFFRGL